MSVYGILAGIFAVVMICVAMPTTVLVHTRPRVRIFQVINVISLIVAVVDLIGIFVVAYLDQMIKLWYCVFLCVVSLAFAWFMIWILQRKNKERVRYYNDAYAQTDQHPEREDYGFTKENPIWTGTAVKYLDKLFTKDGKKASWKYVGAVKLYSKNEEDNFEYKGFTDCVMSKYDLIVDGQVKDTLFICRKQGFDQLPFFHAPKGYDLK